MNTRRMTRFAFLFIVIPLLSIASTGGSLAQGGPMRFLVGLAAGGAVDPYARVIADQMSKILGQTIIVENKPGAGGNLSAQYMIEAPANGMLVWVSTMALTEINPSVYSNLNWSIDQFTPIIKGVQAPLVLVAHPSVPANNLAEFVAWAKANRGKLGYSSYTAGTPSHFLGFQLNEKYDLDLTHVPYRGSGLQVTGLIAGHSLFGFAQVNNSAPQVAAGKLKAFGITSAERWPSMKDVPTFAELGLPEFTARVWFGLLVKAGTPPEIVARLTDAAKAAHDDPEVRKKLEVQGYEVTGETGPQLMTDIKAQQVRWNRLVKAAGFSSDDRGSTK
jgi:tripartite-type tricarboxylate transporter receptor subunit TctC